MDNRPVGIFDYGLGGLTAVAEIQKILPSEHMIYFGDTSRVPYGGKSKETLLKYARQDMAFLRSFNIKAVVVACGTVSTNALTELRSECDLPVLGVVEPACRRAVELTKNKKVGMIATAASVRSGCYERTVAALDGTVEVTSLACPLFVPLVENGRCRADDRVVRTVAEEYLIPLKEKGIDTLILGCTHYPLLTEVISEVMGSGVELINAGAEAAWELKRILTAEKLLSEAPQGTATLYASDINGDFEALASRFLQKEVRGVTSVDIDRF